LMLFINLIVTVQAESGDSNSRLSARVVRDVLFSATSPNGNRELYLTANKSDLKDVPDTTGPITHRWEQDRGPLLTLEPNPLPGANLGGRPIARGRGGAGTGAGTAIGRGSHRRRRC
jgi:hypothetical protein